MCATGLREYVWFLNHAPPPLLPVIRFGLCLFLASLRRLIFGDVVPRVLLVQGHGSSSFF